MVDCQNHRHIRIRNSRCIQMVPAAAVDFDFVDCFDFDFDFVDCFDCFEFERVAVLAVV